MDAVQQKRWHSDTSVPLLNFSGQSLVVSPNFTGESSIGTPNVPEIIYAAP